MCFCAISIGGGPNQLPLITWANHYGFPVVVVDRENHGLDLSKNEHLQISTNDTDQVLSAIQGRNHTSDTVKAVLYRGSGISAFTASEVAKRFNLPFFGTTIVRASISKEFLYRFAFYNNINTIPSQSVESIEQLPNHWGQIVIKPDIPQIGKLNVYTSRKEELVGPLFDAAKKESLNHKVLVQPYLEGRDIGVVTLSKGGVLVWNCFFEEVTHFSEGRLTSNGVYTLDNSPSITVLRSRLLSIVRSVIAKYGTTGFVIFSFRCNNQDHYLYEINVGLAGDGLAEKFLPTTFPGYNFFQLDVCNTLGLHYEFPSQKE